MARIENGSERVTVGLRPGNKEYVDALAAQNEMSGGFTEALNGVIHLVKKLGALGVTDRLVINDPVSGENITYILPLELIDLPEQAPQA
jgi:hypothetical protein